MRRAVTASDAVKKAISRALRAPRFALANARCWPSTGAKYVGDGTQTRLAISERSRASQCDSAARGTNGAVANHDDDVHSALRCTANALTRRNSASAVRVLQKRK